MQSCARELSAFYIPEHCAGELAYFDAGSSSILITIEDNGGRLSLSAQVWKPCLWDRRILPVLCRHLAALRLTRRGEKCSQRDAGSDMEGGARCVEFG
jgi:hypothetical protein